MEILSDLDDFDCKIGGFIEILESIRKRLVPFQKEDIIINQLKSHDKDIISYLKKIIFDDGLLSAHYESLSSDFNYSYFLNPIKYAASYSVVPKIETPFDSFIQKRIDFLKSILQNSSYPLSPNKKNKVKTKKRKSIPKPIKILIWERDMGRIYSEKCPICKTVNISSFDFHACHITSVKNGGSDKPENLTPGCSSCNLSMGDENLEDFIKRFY